jgi:uncharacterized repeat protein (TIGR01451 family)
VVNDGNVTLTGVNTSDSIVGPLTSHTDSGAGTHGDGNLDPGEIWTYTAVYDTQQSDIDNHGSVDGTADNNIHNTATVTTTQGAGGSDSADVGIDYRPAILLDKAGTFADDNHDGFSEVGEHINYTFAVDNTGNVTLHNVSVSDPSVSVTGGTVASLAPGASDSTTWTATYAITQTDIDNGFFDNTAAATATEASTSDSEHVVLPPAPPPPPTSGISIDDNNSLSQLSDPGGDGPSVGDPIQFFFQITNLGNTTLTNVAVSDTLGDAVPGSLQTPVPSTLAGNATFGDTFNHFLTAADITAGHVVDDITVTALDYLTAVQTATWHYDFDLFP